MWVLTQLCVAITLNKRSTVVEHFGYDLKEKRTKYQIINTPFFGQMMNQVK